MVFATPPDTHKKPYTEVFGERAHSSSKMYGKRGEVRALIQHFEESCGVWGTTALERLLGVPGGSTIWRWKEGVNRPSSKYALHMVQVALFALDGVSPGDIFKIDWDATFVHWQEGTAQARRVGDQKTDFRNRERFLQVVKGVSVKPPPSDRGRISLRNAAGYFTIDRFKGGGKMYSSRRQASRTIAWFEKACGIGGTAHLERLLGVRGGSTVWCWKNGASRPESKYALRMLQIAILAVDGLPVSEIHRIDWDGLDEDGKAAWLIYWEEGSAKAKAISDPRLRFNRARADAHNRRGRKTAEELGQEYGEAIPPSPAMRKAMATHNPPPPPDSEHSYARHQADAPVVYDEAMEAHNDAIIIRRGRRVVDDAPPPSDDPLDIFDASDDKYARKNRPLRDASGLWLRGRKKRLAELGLKERLFKRNAD